MYIYSMYFCDIYFVSNTSHYVICVKCKVQYSNREHVFFSHRGNIFGISSIDDYYVEKRMCGLYFSTKAIIYMSYQFSFSFIIELFQNLVFGPSYY